VQRQVNGRRTADLGATSVEYAMLATFIAVAVALAIGGVGLAVIDLFTSGVDIPWGG